MLGVPTSSSSTHSWPLWKCTHLGQEPVYSCWANGWEGASAMGSDPLRAASVTTRPEEVTIARWKRGSWPDPATHSLSIPHKGSRGRKYFFLPAFFKRINSSMKQIPLFLPSTVRSWAPKVLQYKGLGWNTAPWHTRTRSHSSDFLPPEISIAQPVCIWTEAWRTFSSSAKQWDCEREGEGGRANESARVRDWAGGRRERECEREIGTGETKQTEWDDKRMCGLCLRMCVFGCRSVEKWICRYKSPLKTHAVSDGDELVRIMEGRAN